ncbi:MAG: hypothetical protein B7733_18025 [Myxococcales bacterium FL481]|nr:MAG: hypothetical protein B7733_18025 [Myxococcales bacterium FL481]
MRGPIACAMLAFACGPRPDARDPLDPDVLEDLGQEQGNAVGDTWSGVYRLESERIDCNCPTISDAHGSVAICELETLNQPEDARIEVIQADGQLLWLTPVEEIRLTGSVDANGSFVVTAVQTEAAAAVTLQSLSRAEGQLERPPAPRFHADYWQRVSGELGDETIDCRSHFDVVGTRIDGGDSSSSS